MAKPLRTTTHGHSPGVKVEMLALVHREVTQIYPPLKLRVSVDDTAAFINGREKQGAGGDCRKCFKNIEERVHQEGILEEVEHVKAHRSKREVQQMSLFEKFITEGSEKGDEPANERGWTEEMWRM